MIQDDLGVYRLERNGTLFSFDRNDTVVDSKQLTGEEFKALSGCNMVAPGMPSSADHETEQCLLKRYTSTIPNSDVSVNSRWFEQDCDTIFCYTNSDCVTSSAPSHHCQFCFAYPYAGGPLGFCSRTL
jgi:hypothetical protein